MISVIVVTHNRVHLLQRCVEDVVARTSRQTSEIIIWDNASADATGAYLETLDDPRIRVIRHEENIAMNARARAFALAQGQYLIEVDDDVVEAPPNWDEILLEAYVALPEVGRLAAWLAYDPNDTASRYLRFMREESGAYPLRVVNNIRLYEGTPGGACTMVSRELYEQVGGYREHRRHPYWRPELPFERAMRRLGYTSAFLADLEVRHAGGEYYAPIPEPKWNYHAHEWRRRALKDMIKRALLALPFASAVNRRFELFHPPAPRYDPATYQPDAQEAEASKSTRAT